MWRSPSSSAMTRSFSVTTPTQRPPSLTTGSAETSCSLNCAITSSTVASRAIEGASRSMISATVVAAMRGRTLFEAVGGQGVRQLVDDVRRDPPVGPAEDPRGAAARLGMDVHGGAGRLERRHPAGQERAEDAGEDIAG